MPAEAGVVFTEVQAEDSVRHWYHRRPSMGLGRIRRADEKAESGENFGALFETPDQAAATEQFKIFTGEAKFSLTCIHAIKKNQNEYISSANIIMRILVRGSLVAQQ